jgi:uncharacterized membrane protein YeaQ/YmgE (transglycosylase-associated protein family)
MLSASITVGLGVFAGLLVHRLMSSTALGRFADMLFGVAGALAARLLTDLVLQTHSLSVAAVPLILGSAAALPAWIHIEMERRKEDSSARRIATLHRTRGSQD